MKVINTLGMSIDFDYVREKLDPELRDLVMLFFAPTDLQSFFNLYESAYFIRYGHAWELSKEIPYFDNELS